MTLSTVTDRLHDLWNFAFGSERGSLPSFTLAVFWVATVVFSLFFVLPIFESVRGAFTDVGGNFTFAYLVEVFANRLYVEGLWNSFALGLGSTALTFLIAIPLAFLADRFQFPGKALAGALLLTPMVLPPFVGAIGIHQILGHYGAFNSLLLSLGLIDPAHPIDWLGQHKFLGIIALNALHLYPILYLNVLATLSNLDPALDEAAENMGCTGWRKFLRVTLPLIVPGLFAGGTIIFIWSFTELGVPLMFEYYRVTPVQIFSGIRDLGSSPFPFALVTVMLAVTCILYGASKYFFGGQGHAMMSKAVAQSGPRPLPGWRGWLCLAAFLSVTFLAILPHLGVILVSVSRDWYQTILPVRWTLEHYQAALGHNLTVPAIANSLKYAGLATVLNVILGVAIAYVVVRSRIPARHALDAMSMLPLAVPGLVLAFGYVAMTQDGKLFHFLSPTTNPLPLLVIAYAIRRLPYVVRAAAAGFQQCSETLEEAAQNLGCPPVKSILKITLPLIAANILSGALLAFAFGMLEVSDSLVLAQRQEDFPITKAIYELSLLLGQGKYLASALGVWAMIFLAVTLVGASVILGRKLGSLFRV